MPALPSFINYKSGRKAKTIKSPFSLLRGEPSTSTATANLPRNYLTTEVIDIHDQTARYSLDFDGGKPIDDYENPIVDQEPPYQGAGTSSPQVQLDIDFSQALTDWFPPDLLQSEQLNGVAEGLKPGGSGLRNEVANTSASTGGLGFENGRDSSTANDDEDGGSSTLSSSEDIIANLRAMNVSPPYACKICFNQFTISTKPSHFGKLPGYDDFNRLVSASNFIKPNQFVSIFSRSNHRNRPKRTSQTQYLSNRTGDQ
jgi:hypothetical protein